MIVNHETFDKRHMADDLDDHLLAQVQLGRISTQHAIAVYNEWIVDVPFDSTVAEEAILFMRYYYDKPEDEFDGMDIPFGD